MSDNEEKADISSQDKLLYSRDFLLSYSSIKKTDQTITEKLVPVLNTPLGYPSSLPKKPKNPVVDIAATGTNPRLKNSSPVFFQKENTLNLSHPVLTKPGPESFTSPVKKPQTLVTTTTGPRPPARPFSKPPLSNRKTWTAVESNGLPSALSSQDVLEQLEHDSLLTADHLHALISPLSSPNFKTPISKSLHDAILTPNSTPAQSDAQYFSPKSSSGTPYKSPSSPLMRFASSKSPRSPIRPISPLDEQRLGQRQKQIDYGYRTVGYLRYRLLVAKDHRKPEHPRTPKKTQGCSKRSWDGQLKKWRRDLHLWDPDNVDAFKALLNSDLVVSIIAANPELAEIVDIVKEKLDNPTPDFDDDYLGEDSDLSTSVPLNQSVPALPSLIESGNIEKKISPRNNGDDNKVQNKVARTLVF